jgi:hypothetical protein
LNPPITLDLEAALIGGNEDAGFLFTKVLLPNGPFAGSGSFDINFTTAEYCPVPGH